MEMALAEVSGLTEWENEPSVMILQEDLAASKPAHDVQVGKINTWNNLRNITGSVKFKANKGRSGVQPKLIRKQAEWRYSALSEPFLGTTKLFSVEPRTFEDNKASKQNQLLLNWQFNTKINKVNFIDEYVRTTVDEGTSIVRVSWIRETEMRTVQVPVFQYLEATQQEEIDALQQALELSIENPNEFKNLPEEAQASAEYFKETGIPNVAQIAGYQDTQEEFIVNNHPSLDVIDPANVTIDPSCLSKYEDARFFIVSSETSYGELKKDGRYKNLEKVMWESNAPLSQPDHETTTPDSFNFKDKARKRVVSYEYWGWYDINNDGILKAIVATWIGNVMIRMEENPYPDQKPPFIVTTYAPVKRSIYGEPDAEILEDNQAILGAVTRGTIDLLGRSANSQQGFAKGFMDITNRRRFDSGQDYEYNPGSDPRISVFQHKYPEIPNSALTMMGMQNQEAEALTGVKSFTGGISGDSYGDVATGIKGALDASAKREMNILRRLAKGVQDIGTKIASMNAVFLSEEEVVRVTNTEYVVIRREDLKGNFDLLIDISTAEVDETKSNNLGFMLQTIGPNMDPSMTKLILAEIATLKRMPELAHKIEKYEPKPDPLQEKIKELEAAKLEAEVMELQSKIELNKAKAQEAYSQAAQNGLDLTEQADGTKHAREIEKQSGQAKGNQNLEVTKSILKSLKPDESKPNIEAAVGFNQLSKLLDNADTQNSPSYGNYVN